MNSNIRLYCNMIGIIEKKRNEMIQTKAKQRMLSHGDDELLKKYDALLLEKYKKLEKMLQKEN